MRADSEQFKTGATGWHSISEYQKTKNNIKNKGSTHSPLLPPWCFFFYLFFFASPVSRNPSTPSPANSARLQDLAYFSSLWLSVTVTKLNTRWEGSRELPGEPAVMVVESSDSRRCCMCHVFGTPSPKIHDQAHYFYHIINPQQSKAPWSMSVMNSYLPDGRSMAHLSFGHNKSLLAQRGSRVRVPEIKPVCFYVMQNKNKEGQRHVLQEEYKYLYPK